MLTLLLLLLAQPQPDYTQQAVIDREAAREAARAGRQDWRTARGEPVTDRFVGARGPWSRVGDAAMRGLGGYTAPPGYRYHTAATADLDRDGRPDRVELVTNGAQNAVRITYGARGKQARMVERTSGPVSGASLFPAGRHAVMFNYPEVGVAYLFERRGRLLMQNHGD